MCPFHICLCIYVYTRGASVLSLSRKRCSRCTSPRQRVSRSFPYPVSTLRACFSASRVCVCVSVLCTHRSCFPWDKKRRWLARRNTLHRKRREEEIKFIRAITLKVCKFNKRWRTKCWISAVDVVVGRSFVVMWFLLQVWVLKHRCYTIVAHSGVYLHSSKT